MTRTICLIICIALCEAPGGFANSTLLASEQTVRTGAKALGLCDSFTALADDLSAPLWNSAGLAKIDRFNLEFDLFGELLAMSYELENYGTISAYAISLDESNFIPIFEQDRLFGMAYGKEFEDFMLGAGLDYKRSAAGKDFGLNTGFISTPIPQLSLGIDFRLFFDEVSRQEKKLNYLAKHTTFGVTFQPVERLKHRAWDAVLLGSVDANLNQLAFGTELKYRFFSIRGGTSFKIGTADEVEPRLTYGFGLDLDYVQLNYVHMSHPISKACPERGRGNHQYAASVTFSYPKRPPIEPSISTRSIPVTSVILPKIAHTEIEPLSAEWLYQPNFDRRLFQLQSKPRHHQIELAIALTQRYPWQPQRIRHVVKKGESLWNICQKYKDRIVPEKYRNPKELAKLNKIDDPSQIKPGDLLFIPVAQGTDQKAEGGYESALEKLNMALVNDPSNPVILNNLAVVLVKRNVTLSEAEGSEFYSALEKLEKASKIAPEHPVLNSNLGLLYIYTGEINLAENYLKKAVESMPKLAAVHCNLGLLYLEKNGIDTPQKDGLYKKQAISEFMIALSLDEKCLDAMFNLAKAYEKNGMKEKSQQTLRRLAEIVKELRG